MMRALAVVFVVLVFIAGIAAGVAIDRAWLLDGPPRGPHGAPPLGGPRGRPPVERFFEELTEELSLTSEQRATISRVLDEAQRDARAIMEQSRPALDAARDKTRARVLEVLTPEQRVKFEELEKKRPRTGPPGPPLGPPHGPPPHGPPPHGPPPPGPPPPGPPPHDLPPPPPP